MYYRKLGKTDIKISEIGFGAWGIGGWGPTDDADAIKALLRAYDLGVTFFDTAYVYGDGHSEELIGRALGDKRQKVVISSKIPPQNGSNPVTNADPIKATFSKEWIIRCTERSLKKLGTDYLDIQQLHAWTDAYTREDEWLEAFLSLKKQGKVRAFGVSANDWDPYSAENLARSGLVDSIQVIYNIFEQRPVEKLFPAAQEGKTGIIVRVPFEEGLLTGKMGPDYVFPQGDWRAEWATPERLKEAAPRVEALKQFLSPDRPDLPRLALKFCLSHPAVSTVIPGMRRPGHVDANVAASDGKLIDEATLEVLKKHAFTHGWKYPWAR